MKNWVFNRVYRQHTYLFHVCVADHNLNFVLLQKYFTHFVKIFIPIKLTEIKDGIFLEIGIL
jgi:hypothetical protein